MVNIMHQQFLCPVHRKWVYQFPLETIEQIETAKAQGESLRQQQRWEEALPYLGCALEMTEILMDINRQRGSRYGLLYTALSVAVADTLYRLQKLQMASDFLQESASWLNGLQRPKTSKMNYLNQCINTLKRGAVFFTEILNRSSNTGLSAKLH